MTAANGDPLQRLLDRLPGVQKSGKGYRSMCPLCGGKSRKLALREGETGAILLHCFSCGDPVGILAAIGLSLADLYPERIRDASPEARRDARQAFKQTAWGAALNILTREATLS